MNTKLTSILIFTCLTLAAASQSNAQEHVGHRHRYQEQQQQAPQPFKRHIIRGAEAEELFQTLSKTHRVMDLSSQCSAPVFSVGELQGTICFDRTETVTHISRYKCYVAENKYTSYFNGMMFDLFHNECGGGGIHPKR